MKRKLTKAQQGKRALALVKKVNKIIAPDLGKTKPADPVLDSIRKASRVCWNSDKAEASHWLMRDHAYSTIQNVRKLLSVVRDMSDGNDGNLLDLTPEGLMLVFDSVDDVLKLQADELDRNQKALFRVIDAQTKA